MDTPPKKSAAVPLVLMGAVAGAVALPALFGGTDVQRNRYGTREDCIADYSEAQCRPDFPISGYAAGAATYYYGPWYRSNINARAKDMSDPGAGHFYHGGASGFSSAGLHGPAAVEAGTRGGFGSHGHVSARGS